MEKEISVAALARIIDDRSFPFISIGSTNASSADVACVEYSSDVLQHEAPVNERVFFHKLICTIPQSAPHKTIKHVLTWVHIGRA